jgi:predicted NUDIX family phosphoesterase
MAYDNERVLCIPRSILTMVGLFQGFRPLNSAGDPVLSALFHAKTAHFLERARVEQDPNWKQLIPYVIFHTVATTTAHWLFQYQRTKQQGEERLHGLRSIGVGGHIRPDDSSLATPSQSVGGPFDQYCGGLARELQEEVQLQVPTESQAIIGLVNYEADSVGRVHLGIVHEYRLDSTVSRDLGPRELIRPLEPSMADVGFWSMDELLRRIDEFETWSQECLKGLAKLWRLE